MKLSKSRYIAGMQCPKILWCKQNVPDSFDSSVINQAILDAANSVGDTAMAYFGEFSKVPFDIW